MPKSPWGNAPKENNVKVPKDADALIDVIIQFATDNNAHQAIAVMTVSLGMILQTMDKKDLENVRTIFDQMKFDVIDTLSESGWK